MTIEGDGKVGIGTSAPGKTLDVNGDVRIRGDAGKLNFYRSTSPEDIAYIQYNNGASRLDIAANNKDIVFMNENGPAESMRINNSGSVGIGTTSPATALDVVGEISGLSSGYNTFTRASADPSGTGTVIELMYNKSGGGAVADGRGVRIGMGGSTSTTAGVTSMLIDVPWTDITHATRTSDLVIQLVDSGTVSYTHLTLPTKA